jgi:DNA-binding winged helix-turn-helix (wHTH) protein/Tol biopolymer transport system component
MAVPSLPSPTIRFGPFELDAAAAELRKNGNLIKLQPQPLKVLLLLTQRGGQVVTREEIQRCLWSDSTFVDFERGINFSINQIRGALADDAEKPRYIETLPRRGYRFVASVIHIGAGHVGSSEISPQESEPSGPSPTGPTVASPSQPLGTTSSRWRSSVLALLVITIALGITYGVRSSMPRDHRPNLERIHVAKLTDSGNVGQVAISPDGRYVCYSLRERTGSGLWLNHVATRSDTQILPADAIAFEGITFSSDGNYIYYVKADKNDPGFKYLYSIPVLGGPSRLLVKDIDSPVSFSPDGREFVYTRGIPIPNNIEIRIANADGSGNHLLATLKNTFPGFEPGATWSTDGRIIAVSSLRYGKQSFTLDTVAVSDGSVHELYSSPRAIGRPLWLPEGDTVLLVMDDQNGRGQLWTISYPKAEVRRVTNDLTDYRVRADLTRDAKTLIAAENSVASNIWVAPAANLSEARQITSLALPLFSPTETPDGHLLVVSSDGKLWSLRADSGQRIRLGDLEYAADPTSCGHFVVFSSFKTAATGIMRVDSNGENPISLIGGDVGSHVCTADGKYVYYEDLGPPHMISRIPIEGGPPVKIAEVLGEFLVGRLSISPDARFLAYPYEEYTPAPVLKLAIIPAKGGPPERIITAPGAAYAYGSLLWSPGGKSLQYILTANGASNVWEQRLDGSKARQLTTFAYGRIFDFQWSVDGKRLLLSRGEVSSDAVQLSNLR